MASRKRKSILMEAEALTEGARQSSYGHPIDNFTHTVNMINAAFAHKLKSALGPEDFAIIMMLCKISRELHKHKRDNLADLAGYANCYMMVKEKQKRRRV